MSNSPQTQAAVDDAMSYVAEHADHIGARYIAEDMVCDAPDAPDWAKYVVCREADSNLGIKRSIRYYADIANAAKRAAAIDTYVDIIRR